MYKLTLFSIVALVASASGAPGGLVVPLVASAPAVAVAHPVHVATSYSNTYRAPVVKAIPVVKTVPVVAAPLVAAQPIVKTIHQVVAHPAPTILKTAPLVAHAPVVHAVVPGLPITSYANHYNVAPAVVKTHVVAAPIAIVH